MPGIDVRSGEIPYLPGGLSIGRVGGEEGEKPAAVVPPVHVRGQPGDAFAGPGKNEIRSGETGVIGKILVDTANAEVFAEIDPDDVADRICCAEEGVGGRGGEQEGAGVL